MHIPQARKHMLYLLFSCEMLQIAHLAGAVIQEEPEAEERVPCCS